MKNEMNVTKTQNRFLSLTDLNSEQYVNKNSNAAKSNENIPHFFLHFLYKIKSLLNVLKSVKEYYRVMK